ncbi:MAG: 3-isopropylmalate dehydratase small subunit [Pseudomonadota bacterium]|nr:3-isopropylmalate dehydratase small subunit [Gammaproteobacteria bacterium]MEC8868142.1 3-isopropylmalate dehydratase small subunit [Pseudomonadota bacterium]MEC9285986.1 3-isopropylmalate dehydratase small subunit [Pseudomonadota bacterium]HBP14608.1 3-isopropylmalate dehydratase small subunit [Gammaproteobacteria bacterium]|tara:strand:+ start:251 stop:895 length:645 start_codon:yes stop_codon:yes gene_type:complete
MKPFKLHRGTVVPLDRANVDTDQIIPKQFLKSVKRTGFGENLFDAWRFNDEGEIGKNPNEREINREFVFNDPRYQDVSILLGRQNFGCGSSREHAVWALLEFGIRCVIAPSFADIFYNNCFKNGLLPIVIKEEIIENLFGIAKDQLALEVEVNLETQSLSIEAMDDIFFEIEPGRKEPLLLGLDDIGMTFMHSDQIREFEVRHRQAMPWIFDHD